MLKVSPILKEFKTQRVECLKALDEYMEAEADFYHEEEIKHEMIEYLEGVNIKEVPNKEAQIEKNYREIDQYYNKYVLTSKNRFYKAAKKLINIFYELVEIYKGDLPDYVYDIYNDYKNIINFNMAKRESFIDALLFEVSL